MAESPKSPGNDVLIAALRRLQEKYRRQLNENPKHPNVNLEKIQQLMNEHRADEVIYNHKRRGSPPAVSQAPVVNPAPQASVPPMGMQTEQNMATQGRPTAPPMGIETQAALPRQSGKTSFMEIVASMPTIQADIARMQEQVKQAIDTITAQDPKSWQSSDHKQLQRAYAALTKISVGIAAMNTSGKDVTASRVTELHGYYKEVAKWVPQVVEQVLAEHQQKMQDNRGDEEPGPRRGGPGS